MNLNDARQRIPELAGLSDASAIDVIHQVYYPGMDKMELSKRLGYEPPSAPTESAGVFRTLGDLGIKGAQGVVDLGASVVGMGNMLSGGLVGQGMDAIGYDPKRTNASMGEYLSTAQKAADQRVQDAQGFWGTLGQAVTEPRFIAGSVAQSVPGMLGIGAMQSAAAGVIAGRAALATAEGAAAAAGKTGAMAMQAALATRAGQSAAQTAVDAAGSKLMGIGAASEGAQSMGSIAQDAQQSGRTWLQYAPGALAAGLGTGAIAFGAGKLMGDAGTEVFTGAHTKLGNSLPVRMAKSGFSEGALEEMPQSAQERYFSNVAMGEADPMKGVAEDAATGLLTGGAMGIGMGGMHGQQPHAPTPAAPTQPEGPMARAVRAGGQVMQVPPVAPAAVAQNDIARMNAQAAQAAAQAAELARQADEQARFDALVAQDQFASQTPSEMPTGTDSIPSTNPGDANGNEIQTPSQATEEVLTPTSGTPNGSPAESDNAQGDVNAQTPQTVQTETQPDSQAEPKALPEIAPAELAAPVPDPVLTRSPEIDSGPAVVLQNRDRSSAASIAQMNEIAARPDYLRAGQSSVMDSGAPVVFGDLPSSALVGKTQEIADGKGQRTPIQYAVVDAADLIASHSADGTTVDAYAVGAPGKLRAVAGNGRTAGIIEGYQRGTAEQYRQDLSNDASALGFDPAGLAAMKAPVLVRVMDGKDVTADIGDRSNISNTARLSSVEQASTDARRLNLESLEFHEDGNPTQVAVTQFVRAMPISEQTELIAPDGTPTKQAVDRLMAAAFKQAYGSDELVGLYAQAQDSEARTILSGLADAAGLMSALKDSGEFDIRGAVTEAAGFAVNARRLGHKLADMLKTPDMLMSDEARVVAQFMADNVRSAKKISEGLRNVAEYAAEQAQIERNNKTQGGMFGETPTASRNDILRKLNGNKPIVADARAEENHLQQPRGTPEVERVTQQAPPARPQASPVAASAAAEPATAATPTVASAEPAVEAPALTSYTNADALAREQHLADAPRLDRHEQVQREASGQTLTSETPVETRQDSTGEMFAEEKTQAQAKAAQEELAKKNAGKQKEVDPNQNSMFDDLPSEPDAIAAAPVSAQPVFKPVGESANTGNAGAELSYNKRNRIKNGIAWADIADKDVALRVKETTKQNVHPKPDYQALVDAGMQPLIAHIVKQAYDALAVAPKTRIAPTDAQLQSYIAGVQRYMAGVMAWAGDPKLTRAWIGRMAQRSGKMAGAATGSPISLSDMAGLPEKSLLTTVYPEGWRAHEPEIRLIGSNKALSALQPGVDEAIAAMKDLDKGWPQKQEAWQRQGYTVVNGKELQSEFYESKHFASKQPYVTAWINLRNANRSISIASETFDGVASKADPTVQQWAHVELARLKDKFILLDKRNRSVGVHETLESAQEQARELTRRDAKSSTISDKGISVESAQRQGVEHRDAGEDISSDKLKDTFGFKGVNFGTWMLGESPAKVAERQLHLNHAFDSFMDLATVLGVPPKALSLDGLLGLAIGAQGSGSAAAHFVPGVNEINLTRTSGAGSLAHEWGHALDHYFARQADLTRQTTAFLTEHLQNVDADGYTKRAGQKAKAFGEGIRPEIVAAFGEIVKAMNERPMTPAEYDADRQASLNKTKGYVEGWLKSIRKDFERLTSAGPIKINSAGRVVEVSGAEIQSRFDSLANRVRALDLGEAKVLVGGSLALSEPVAAMRDYYKQLTDRTYSIDQIRGLQSNVDALKYKTDALAASDSHVPNRQVPTIFAKAAARIDQDKGGKPYWSTNLEKFARSFDAFVSDKLEAEAAKNTYLSHAGREGDTVPSGAERTAINAGFQKLVDTLETRQTDSGVAMFSQGAVNHPSNVPAVESAIQELTGTFLGSKLGRIVATTATDIKSTWEPLIGRDVNLAPDSQGRAQGFFDPASKTVFLIADQIEAGTEQAVLAHELMHKHGQAVLGEAGWNHLHGVIDGWKQAEPGSNERGVYDYASARVNAAGADLSTQELFPYAVEGALKLGIKPNAFAKAGTVAKWLAQVKLALKGVWDKLTRKPELFKAQDLVNLAFGIAQRENHAVENFNDGKSSVLSKNGYFQSWPKFTSWTRAEYKDVVSLLPAAYRSDPHRSEPLSPQDWQLRANAAVPEIEALNAKVGEGTFRIDGLGNILADARKNDASIFADEVIDIADKHGLGIYFTGVHTPSIIRLRNAGFVTELGLDMILQRGAREKTDVSYPPKQSDRAWMRPPIPAAQGQVNMRDFGTIMSYKPRGFSSVLFSRAGDIPLIQRATDVLNETFSHPGKLSWWDKTVGSPYHLAQRYPAFKPVFTSAQNFINDVSFYATEAADMAPKMLPKLQSWSDLLKTPISAADNKAISVPILEGTLSWTRDGTGKPMRIAEDDEETTPGIVWSDAELSSMFHLTPPRIALYREFRSSVDKSLDNMAKADLLRIGGRDVVDLKDQVMAAKDVIEAATLLHQHLHRQKDLMPERSDVLIDTARGLVGRANRTERLKQLGYAPLSRFGRYSVDVVVGDERQYFGLFETGRAANQMATRLKAEFGARNVAQGTLSEKEFEMFQGITPESLELFGNMLSLDSLGDQAQDKVFQTYLKRTKSNRSAMKRLIHRKGTAGYSDDMGRVLAAFVYSNARQTSAALHMGELGAAVNDIPKSQGQIKDSAIELATYIKQPREEAQALRAMLFTQYLGGSVASAFVNITQSFAVSIPYLSQFGGAAKAGSFLIAAMKDMSTGRELEASLAKALKVAEEQGVVAPQEVHQLMAQARGASTLRIGDGTRLGEAMTGAANNFSKLMLGWGKMFGMAEQINRRSTFIAAYRLAQERKIANPAGFATRAVNETQFINNKANKANWARGPVGATLMTFKSYSVNYLELLHRMATQGGPEGRQAALLMLGTLMLMAGSSGLPFVDDAEDLIDFLGQRLGYNFSSKKTKQEFLENLFGRAGAQFVDKGLTGLPGSPIDVSGRLSMANLIPGTGLLLKKADHTRDVAELAGPMGDMAARVFQAGDQALSGDLGKAAVTLAPKAVGNLAKGVDMMSTGMYRDDKGYKVIETTPTEAAMKMFGFQPATVAEVQQANYLHQRSKDFYNQHAQDIRARWAKGIFENSPAQIESARLLLDQWNVQNPDQRIGVNMQAVVRRVKEMRKSKDQRIADTAPKAMRASMRREVEAMREGVR